MSNFVPIYTFYNFSSAKLAKTLLDAEGIESQLISEYMGVLYQGVIGIRMHVLENDLVRALELLEIEI